MLPIQDGKSIAYIRKNKTLFIFDLAINANIDNNKLKWLDLVY